MRAVESKSNIIMSPRAVITRCVNRNKRLTVYSNREFSLGCSAVMLINYFYLLFHVKFIVINAGIINFIIKDFLSGCVAVICIDMEIGQIKLLFALKIGISGSDKVNGVNCL